MKKSGDAPRSGHCTSRSRSCSRRASSPANGSRARRSLRRWNWRRAIRVSQGTVRKAIDELAAEHIVDAPPGQGHVRRLAQRAFVPVPLPARDAGFRRASCIRTNLFFGARARQGRAASRARASASKAGRPTVQLQARDVVRRAARDPRRDRVRREPVPRPHAGRARGIPRLGLQLLRDGLRRAHDPRRGAPARGGRGRSRPRTSRSPTGTPLLCVDRVAFTYGDKPVEWRRGLCVTEGFSYFNELN